MASCKDCIHDKVCSEYFSAFWGHTANKHSDLINADTKDCPYFKGRSRFVELPIKPGEKIFYFDTAGHIYESTVTQLVYGASGFLIDSDVMFNSNLIGERFFLTREAAEQALKERGSNA